MPSTNVVTVVSISQLIQMCNIFKQQHTVQVFIRYSYTHTHTPAIGMPYLPTPFTMPWLSVFHACECPPSPSSDHCTEPALWHGQIFLHTADIIIV